MKWPRRRRGRSAYSGIGCPLGENVRRVGCGAGKEKVDAQCAKSLETTKAVVRSARYGASIRPSARSVVGEVLPIMIGTSRGVFVSEVLRCTSTPISIPVPVNLGVR